MRHHCNLCFLYFGNETILKKHVAVFHTLPDPRRFPPVMPVVLEKIKIEPELIVLDEEEKDNDHTTFQLSKQPPNPNLKECVVPQILRRLRDTNYYQCKVCFENFPLLRYFRKHLANSEEQTFSKCQEYYKTNTLGHCPASFCPAAQIISCKECFLTCASFKHLCIHYSKHHNLPAVVLTPVDKQSARNSVFSNKIDDGIFRAEDDLCRKISTNYLQNPHGYELRKKRQPLFVTMLKKPKFDFSKHKKESHGNVRQKQDKLISTDKNGKLENRVNHTKSHQCNVYQKELASRPQLKQHKLHTHQRNSLECDHCHKKYTTEGNLKVHKLSAHEKFRFKCDLCQKDFSRNHDLKLHKLASHDDLCVKCDLCPKQCTCWQPLGQHKLLVHDVVRHKCESCLKKFAYLGNLRKHKLVAHDGVRYKCEVCLKKYTSKETLKNHKLITHDGVRHKCEFCLKEFKLFAHFKLHKLTHNDKVHK